MALRTWLLLAVLFVPSVALAAPLPHLFCFFNGALLGSDPTITWAGLDVRYGCAYDLPAGRITTHVYLDDELVQSDTHLVTHSPNPPPDDSHFWSIDAALFTDCCVEPRAGRLEVDVSFYDPRTFTFTLVQSAQVIPEPATLVLVGSALIGLHRWSRQHTH